MMFTPDFVTLYLLLASNTVLAAAVAIAAMRVESRLSRFEQFWNSPTGAALAEQNLVTPPPSQPPETHHLERRVTELQNVVTKLTASQKLKSPEPEPRWPIENAVRMARHGASIDDLIRSCGLNIGEAQLMRKLHGKIRDESRVN
jgi:hypothetical protein